MVTGCVNSKEVLDLIDFIESPEVSVDSKMTAIRKLEDMIGMDIPGTKAFRALRNAFIKGEGDDYLRELGKTLGKDRVQRKKKGRGGA